MALSWLGFIDIHCNDSHYNLYYWKMIGVHYIHSMCAAHCSVVHLSCLIVDVLWLGIFDIIVTFSIGHGLVQICLVLSLLHMKREILVVAIHVGGVGIWNNFIDGDWAFDGFVLLVKHL